MLSGESTLQFLFSLRCICKACSIARIKQLKFSEISNSMSVRVLNFLGVPKHLTHSVNRKEDRSPITTTTTKCQIPRAPVTTAECPGLLSITGDFQYWEASPRTMRIQGPVSRRHLSAPGDECSLSSRVRAERRFQHPPLSQRLSETHIPRQETKRRLCVGGSLGQKVL